MSEVQIAAPQPGDRYDRLAAAVWEAVDRPIPDIIDYAGMAAPGATLDDIAAEYAECIKIGLDPDLGAALHHRMGNFQDPNQTMAVWRLVGLIGRAI